MPSFLAGIRTSFTRDLFSEGMPTIPIAMVKVK
jgi:hypothetical protein